MPLYVLALTDAALGADAIGGRVIQDVQIDGIHAICERRNEMPQLTDDALRRQHADVVAIARRVPAVLPARFGSLLTRNDLIRRVRTHEADLRRGLEEVRGRVQMTVRVLGSVPQQSRPRASSGREYLEQRRRAALPDLPTPARAFIDAVTPLVAAERHARGAGGLLVTLYHLVDAADVPPYEAIARKITGEDVIVTGPWPPFAFAPPLL